MTEVNPISRPKRIAKAILKVLGYGCLVLIAVLIAAHFTWKYSGTSTWKLERSKKGIEIYSMKVPGSTLKNFKAVRRVKTTLNRVVAAMQTADIQSCKDWFPGCVSERAIEPWNPQDHSFTHYYRVNFPSPFQPREFLLRTQFTQDAPSKSVLVEFIAVPDKLPKDNCCYRITDMHNSWRFTPAENGELNVEFVEHMDQGLPYFLVNRLTPRILYKVLTDLPPLLNKERFQNAKADFIREE